MGVERVNGTQLTAMVQYATVELSGNRTIGQLTVEPAQFGVHYTGTAGSITFATSTVSLYIIDSLNALLFCVCVLCLQTSADIPLNVIDTEVTYPRAFTVTISTSEPQSVHILRLYFSLYAF